MTTNYRDEVCEIEYEDVEGEPGAADKPEIPSHISIVSIKVLGVELCLGFGKLAMEAELERRIKEDVKNA